MTFTRAAVVLAAAVVIVLAAALATRRYDRYLAGLWVGEPAFLAGARLRDMQLFIAPAAAGGRRKGYLIATDADGEFLSNQAVTLRVRARPRAWWSALRSAPRASRDLCRGFSVDASFGGSAIMPRRMSLAVSVLDGTLVLHDRKKVYALLVKDLTASALAVSAFLRNGAN